MAGTSGYGSAPSVVEVSSGRVRSVQLLDSDEFPGDVCMLTVDETDTRVSSVVNQKLRKVASWWVLLFWKQDLTRMSEAY